MSALKDDSLDKYLEDEDTKKKVLFQAWIDEDLAAKIDKFRGRRSRTRIIEALLKKLVDDRKL